MPGRPGSGGKGGKVPYHRSLKVVHVLFELFQGLVLVLGALHYGRDAGRSDIFQDGLELIRRGRILGDVEVERVAPNSSLRRIIAGLVLRRRLGDFGGHLLQEKGYANRSRRAGLVEEGDDVGRLVLNLGPRVSTASIEHIAPMESFGPRRE